MVILLLICGCIPKLGALANIIPLPVLGGNDCNVWYGYGLWC